MKFALAGLLLSGVALASAGDVPSVLGDVDCPTTTQLSTSVVCIRARTGPARRQNYAVNINLDTLREATPDAVALFAGNRIHDGGPQGWALNTVTHIDPGASGGVGYELDVNNWACDAGADGMRSRCSHAMQPPVGLLVTGASPYPSSAAIAISGHGTDSAQWHDGLTMLGASIIDRYSIHTDNLTPTDYMLGGAHVVGLDVSGASFSAAAVHLREDQRQNVLWTGEGGRTHNLYADAAGFHMDNPAGSLTLDNAGKLTVSGGISLPPGALVCWSAEVGACVTYHPSTHRFVFGTTGADGSYRPAASIDGLTGDLRILGSLVTNATP